MLSPTSDISQPGCRCRLRRKPSALSNLIIRNSTHVVGKAQPTVSGLSSHTYIPLNPSDSQLLLACRSFVAYLTVSVCLIYRRCLLLYFCNFYFSILTGVQREKFVRKGQISPIAQSRYIDFNIHLAYSFKILSMDAEQFRAAGYGTIDDSMWRSSSIPPHLRHPLLTPPLTMQ